MPIYAITRPAPDGEINMAQCQQYGYDSFWEPLMDIHFTPWPVQQPAVVKGAGSFIFTSQNGIRSFLSAPYGRDYLAMPIFAIGKQTANLARKEGFKHVMVGGGNIENFIPVIEAATPHGLLCHIGAKEERIYEAGTLCEQLQKKGYNAQKYMSYYTKIRNQLQHKAWYNTHHHIIVLLYSPRTADIFIKAYAQNKPANNIIGFYCLSKSIKDVIMQHFDIPCVVANTPTHEAMIELMKNNGDK